MKHIALLFALLLAVAACGDDDASGSTTTPAPESTTTTVEDTTTAVGGGYTAEDTTTTVDQTTTMAEDTTTTVEETTTSPAAGPTGIVFQISSVTFGAGPMVVVNNIGDTGGSLAGYWFCQRPSYAELPDVTLEPGEAVAISLGGSVFLPPPGIQAAEGQLNVGGLNPTSGELALYSSNAFGSSDAIVSYVEWGASDHGRSSVAVAGGVWEAGSFVPTTDATALIQLRSFDDTTPSNWEAF